MQQTPLEDVFESTVLQYVQHFRINLELIIFIFRATWIKNCFTESGSLEKDCFYMLLMLHACIEITGKQVLKLKGLHWNSTWCRSNRSNKMQTRVWAVGSLVKSSVSRHAAVRCSEPLTKTIPKFAMLFFVYLIIVIPSYHSPPTLFVFRRFCKIAKSDY